MTVPKELRFSHNFDSAETKAIAQRRSLALSKPGEIVSIAAYINRLISEDGARNPPKKSRTSTR